jgi:hypothetical protein
VGRFELRIDSELLETVRTTLQKQTSDDVRTQTISELVRTLLTDWLHKNSNPTEAIAPQKQRFSEPDPILPRLPPPGKLPADYGLIRCSCGGVKHPTKDRCTRCNQRLTA